MKTSLLITLSLLLGFSAFGKAAYHSRDQAIRSAEIIAIVDIQKVSQTNAKGRGWTYSEVAEAKIERILKGKLPNNVKLHGGENFICAQVKYKPGKHLVFLRHDKNLLVGVNWHLGVLPITRDSVQWFENNQSIQLKPTLLRTALEEIEAVTKTDWPILVHVRRNNRKPFPELKFAYWQDGTVLLPDTNDAMRMMVGRVEHSEFLKMWTALREAGFFARSSESHVVPDSSYETIMIHFGSESAIHSWHGVLKPGFGGNIETDAAYREFVEMWKKAAASIAEIKPIQLRPLSETVNDGTFRGYIMEKPAETDWLNQRKWKTRANAE